MQTDNVVTSLSPSVWRMRRDCLHSVSQTTIRCTMEFRDQKEPPKCRQNASKSFTNLERKERKSHENVSIFILVLLICLNSLLADVEDDHICVPLFKISYEIYAIDQTF